MITRLINLSAVQGLSLRENPRRSSLDMFCDDDLFFSCKRFAFVTGSDASGCYSLHGIFAKYLINTNMDKFLMLYIINAAYADYWPSKRPILRNL